MGDTVSFADFVLASVVGMVRTVYGEDSAEWKELKSCHGGRWGRTIDNLKRYRQVL